MTDARTSVVPNSETLTAGLAKVIRDPSLAVLDRKPNPDRSTFPAEIVTCRLGGKGGTLRLFIKYGKKEFDAVRGHRGDLSYEARVYRDVLEPLRTLESMGSSIPAYYGVCRDEVAGAPWLIVEYLRRGVRIDWSNSSKAMDEAARWLGTFHALNEPRVRDTRMRFLRRVDREFLIGWS